jgi:DNA polymerase-3 subunit gamma/tau
MLLVRIAYVADLPTPDEVIRSLDDGGARVQARCSGRKAMAAAAGASAMAPAARAAL